MQPGTKIAFGVLGICLFLTLTLGLTFLLIHESHQQRSELGIPETQADAGQLWDAYEENAIAADQKYKGKVIRIKGTVSRITSDTIGFGKVEAAGLSPAAYARLTPQEKKWFKEGYPPNIVCKIDPRFREQFAQAKRDKPFALIGRCLGSFPDANVYKGMVVKLEDCRPAKE
jgi:hypothetical protein